MYDAAAVTVLKILHSDGQATSAVLPCLWGKHCFIALPHDEVNGKKRYDFVKPLIKRIKKQRFFFTNDLSCTFYVFDILTEFMPV